LLSNTNLRTIQPIELSHGCSVRSRFTLLGSRVLSYLGKMPQRVVFSLILLLAIIITGLRDDTSWLPKVPAIVDNAVDTTPTLTLAIR